MSKVGMRKALWEANIVLKTEIMLPREILMFEIKWVFAGNCDKDCLYEHAYATFLLELTDSRMSFVAEDISYFDDDTGHQS